MFLDVITIAGVVTFLGFVFALLSLHVVNTKYNPISDPVSNYAISDYGYLYTAQSFLSGVSMSCLLSILVQENIELPSAGVTGIVFFIISRLIINFFPTDIDSNKTAKGRVHAILAALTFGGISVGLGISSPVLENNVIWESFRTILMFSAVLTYSAAILFLIIAFAPRLKKIFGLIERFIYLGFIVWIGAIYSGLIL